MQSRVFWKAFIVAFGLLFLWVFVFPLTFRNFFNQAFFELQAPAWQGLKCIKKLQAYWFLRSLSKHELVENCRTLARENAYLKLMNLEKEGERRRCSALFKLYALPQSEGFHYEMARVCKRRFDTWTQHMLIDKGKEHGLDEGFGVINLHGVVGRIAKVYQNMAVVELITHPKFRLIVRTEKGNSPPLLYQGILNTPFNLAQGIVLNVPSHFKPRLPVKLVTTSLGTQFPEGLPMGWLQALKPHKGLQKGSVRLHNSPHFIEEVSVLIPVKPAKTHDTSS